MQKNLAVSSSPHLRDSMSTQRIMQEVCLALAPAGIAAIILYGMNAAMLIAASVITAVVAEYVWQKLNKQTVTVGCFSFGRGLISGSRGIPTIFRAFSL